MSEKLDAIIFGATGYSGQVVVEDAVEIFKDFKWGIAGRTEDKLKGVLKKIGNKVKQDLSHIPIIVADVNDETSIDNMAKKCKIVLNCCGPYRFYGEVVVRSCIANGTHHVDISGEPQYIDKMQLKHNEMAEERSTYIISTCAFESIPAEMGVVYAERNFSGTLNSIELYMETNFKYEDKSSKVLFNIGTWNSAIYALQYARELFSYQNKLNRESMPTLKPKLWMNPIPHKTEGLSSYFIPFPATDRASVQRSQRLRYLRDKKRPIQFEMYAGFQSLLVACLLPLYVLFLALMAQFSFTRKLLLKYPSHFSYGLASAQGPLEVNRKAVEFSMIFKAKGWSRDCPESLPPNKEVVVKVSGNDPGYGITSSALLCCAKVVLNEHQKMPGSGGVLPPGMAFAKTQLIDELSRCKSGLKFEIIKK